MKLLNDNLGSQFNMGKINAYVYTEFNFQDMHDKIGQLINLEFWLFRSLKRLLEDDLVF